MPYLILFVGVVIGALVVYGIWYLSRDVAAFHAQLDALLERAKTAENEGQLNEVALDLDRFVKQHAWHRRLEERALVVRSYITGRREGLRYRKANP